ncbi:hypothetical protein J3R83DRAFT_2636, partial [Lanmaoa asiatica]
NYLTWHVHMCALLICTDLWGIVLGRKATPNPSTATLAAIKAFTSRQLKAAAEIALYIEDSQIVHVQSDDPKVIWDALASVHHAC